VPSPTPVRTDTLFELEFVTARSWIASPSRLPIETKVGFEPTLKLVGAPKVPVPVPSKIETLFEP
jgi:hypothetical protein